MMNPVKFLLASLSLAASAQASPVPKALVVDLEREDLLALSQGLSDVFAKKTVAGRFDQPVGRDFWWGTVKAQGISYRFNLHDVHITPDAGKLKVDVDVANLATRIDLLTFNDSGSWYCAGIPIDTLGRDVEVSTDVSPWVDEDHVFHVAAANTVVDLNSGNFAIGRPDVCHTGWGFGWIIRRAIPWTASLMRDKVRQGIEQAIVQEAEKISAAYGKMLEVRVTLPVDARPVPAFYANLGIWPDSFELTPDRLKFFVGADVEFDPDPRFGTGDETESLEWPSLLEAGGRLPSYLGVARGLIEHVFQEANTKGLLRFDLTQDDASGLGELLTAGVVALIIPDATTRFAPEAPVELNFGGAADVHVAAGPMGGPGGIPIIDFLLEDLKLGLSIAGSPYYEMHLDAEVKVALGYDEYSRKLKLVFQHLDAKFLAGAFAPDLSPAPTDLSFNVEFLDFFVKQLNDRMAADGQDLMAMILPALRLGTHEVEFQGASWRDDYVTLDASVR